MAGSSTADSPAFCFDLGSPEAYLAAERALALLPGVEWLPIHAAALPTARDWDAFRCAQEREIALEAVERDAAGLGLQPLRWPAPFPFDSRTAMLAATYARSIGRTVPFTLAAFRQAFAGGRSLAERDNVLIAAAACEMHPAALIKALGRTSVAGALDAATAAAAARGARDVPAVLLGDGRAFHGAGALERAGAALAAAA